MKLILLVVALAALVAAPWIVTDPFYVHLMIMALMWTLLGASWNVLGGFAGQISFGHSAFLGHGRIHHHDSLSQYGDRSVVRDRVWAGWWPLSLRCR